MKEYSFFIDRIRAHQKRTDRMEEAIDAALEELDNGSLIKPFLIANRAEVKRMCITEYDEERTLAETREEGIEEGIEKGIAIGEKRGRAEGTIRILTALVNKGLLSISDAASAAEMTVAEFESAAKAYV